jgi:hypothetical protein
MDTGEMATGYAGAKSMSKSPIRSTRTPSAGHALTAITQLPGTGTGRSRGQRPTRRHLRGQEHAERR